MIAFSVLIFKTIFFLERNHNRGSTVLEGKILILTKTKNFVMQ